MNRFGYNYLAVPDVKEEMRHAHAIDAGGGLFFQTQIDFARRFKSERPKSNVVIRNWPDRSVPASVDDWLKSNRPLAEGDLIVQVNNEVGLIDKNIQFHEALLERIKRDKIKMKLGLFATSVGTPDPDHDWPRAERVLQLANDLYDQTFMIHHEYAGGVITSGFNGGDPAMIQPASWPDDTHNITMWHTGRYRFLKAYLRYKGRPMLRTIIGENGFDFTGDIGKWLTGLKSTKGQYDTVDGWRDLWDQWRTWWPQKDAATAYMDQLIYEDKHIYIDKEVETILLFARWNDGSWGTYQTNPEMDKKMEDYAKTLSTQPPTVPIPTPAPVPNPPPPPPPKPPTNPPPLPVPPTQKEADFNELIALGAEANVLRKAIQWRLSANEVDERDLDDVLDRMEALIEKYQPKELPKAS